MQFSDYLLPAVLLTGIIFSVKSRKLTLTGALTAALLGICLYIGAGYYGILMAAVLFLLAALTTSLKINIKEALGTAERNKGQRTAGQVLANAGTAALMGLLCVFFPDKTALFRVMMAASLASAAADTISSETGMVYGKKFYNILTLKKDQKGLDGVVSLEGTLFGLTASFILAAVYAFSFGWNINFWWIIIAGTVGNFADSIIGATLERRHYVNNNAVNLLNTIIAAFVALLLYQ